MELKLSNFANSGSISNRNAHDDDDDDESNNDDQEVNHTGENKLYQRRTWNQSRGPRDDDEYSRGERTTNNGNKGERKNPSSSRDGVTNKEIQRKIEKEVELGFSKVLQLMSFFLGSSLSSRFDLQFQDRLIVLIVVIIMIVTIKIVVFFFWKLEKLDYLHMSPMWNSMQGILNEIWNVIAVIGTSNLINMINKMAVDSEDISLFLIFIPFILVFVLKDIFRRVILKVFE